MPGPGERLHILKKNQKSLLDDKLKKIVMATEGLKGWVEVIPEAISHNLVEIRRKVGKKVKVLCVIKADAYGHGICEISYALLKRGADYLAVSSTEEAIILRRNGVALPILVFGPSLPEEAGIIVEHQLTATVREEKFPASLSREAKKRKKEVKVHIEVDTGMGRAGIAIDSTVGFAEKLMRLKNLKVEGIYMHFPVAEDREFSLAQIKDFQLVLEHLKEKGIDIPLKHAANSAAILNIPESYFNAVRPGLILYGIYPDGAAKKSINLLPALALKGRISHLRRARAGTKIGYGGTYTVENDTLIAIVPIGYANGYSRFLSNKGEVLIRGVGARIVGRVCMDQMMIDVGRIPDVQVGDEVVLVGKQGDERITIEEIAQKAGTISHDIVCQVGKGLPRKYKKLDGGYFEKEWC